MGFYHGRDDDAPAEKPPGCLDALLITRAVFAVIFWPIVAIFAVVGDGILILALFTSGRPYLALIPVAATAVAIWAFSRWEQHHFRPPDV